MAPTFTPDRQAFREAVAAIAEKARARLPECNGRVEKAVALVLNGDVELMPDGTAQVYSQSNGVTSYRVVNGTCDCHDYARAPSQWCKHRIAHGIQTRVQALRPVQAENSQLETLSPAPETAPEVMTLESNNPPLYEAPASCNVYVTISGHKVQVTLRDLNEQRMLARLATLLQQYPASAAPEPTARPEGWCSLHAVQMKLTTKEGRSWYSHRTRELTWCSGK